MSFYSPRFNPEQKKKKEKEEKKSAVFSSLSLTTVMEVFAGVILAPFALLGPLASVTQSRFLHHAGVCFRSSLSITAGYFLIFYVFFLFFSLPWCITPAAQLTNSGSYLIDRQTDMWPEPSRLWLVWELSSCWHRLGESVGIIGRDEGVRRAEMTDRVSQNILSLCVCVCSPSAEGALKTCWYPVRKTGLNSCHDPDATSSVISSNEIWCAFSCAHARAWCLPSRPGLSCPVHITCV